MRLTLRTLLAYLDGILDPKDHEELAKQVETSGNAKELILRTGDTVRRIRLGAPPVDSPTHDANGVAEYLDNTMSPQDVVEFERRCLESDPELAEAASCHHILKMVLAERADVDEDLRRSMYGLPTSHAEQQRAAAVVERPEEASQATDAPTRSKVPDYLREPKTPLFWRLAPAVGAVAMLAVAAWVFRPQGVYDQAKQGSPDAGAPPAAPSGTADPATEEASSPGEPATSEPATSDAATSNATVPNPAPSEAVAPSAGTEAALVEASPSGADAATEPTKSPDGPTDLIAETTPAIGSEDEPAAADAANTGEAAPAGRVPSAGLVPPVEDSGAALPGGSSAEPDAAAESGARADLAPEAGGLTTEVREEGTEQPDPPAEPAEVGMVSTPREVLLRYDNGTSNWRRVAFGEAGALPSVRAGDRLLSLPYFRPVIAIKGLNVNLSGASLIDLEAEEGDSAGAAIRLVYGRLVLQNTGADASSIRLMVGDRTGVATLERGSVLAVEAERPFQAGRDPMVDPAPLTAAFYVPTGGLTWTSEDAELAIASSSVWREVDGQAGPVSPLIGTIDWLLAEPLTNIQRQAAAEMAQRLVGGEPIWPQLQALKNARRIEQQALAAIASMHVGHYGPSIRALSDGEQRSVWGQEIAALRATMSRSPELARAVRDALTEEREERYVDDLYQLLCGFTPEQVGRTRTEQQRGALRQLVDWLQSDQIDYRVLANHNLEQITGRRGVFNPVGLQRSRESTVARFRNRLEDGELISRAER